MLRLYRAAPDLLPNGDWQNRVVHLLNDSHLGVVTAASSLIHALAEGNPEAYSSAVGFAINRIGMNFMLFLVYNLCGQLL